jgi:hypothetical protein
VDKSAFPYLLKNRSRYLPLPKKIYTQYTYDVSPPKYECL